MTDQLGPDFDDRLKAELDRSEGPTPLPEGARFSRPQARFGRLGMLKPVLAVAGALGILMVAASALAGCPDPSVWTRKAANTFELVINATQASPSPSPDGSHDGHAQPSAKSEPSETAEPSHESPEPSSGSSQEPSESPTASPTPEPDGHDSPNPTPSPTSDGGGDHESPSPSPSGSDS